LDEELRFCRIDSEPELFAVVGPALHALLDGQFVQDARYLRFNDSAFSHLVHERLGLAITHHLRLAVLKFFHPKPKMEVTCNNDGIAVVADPLADQARGQFIASEWTQVVNALVKLMLGDLA
jgi:hypothetical protein